MNYGIERWKEVYAPNPAMLRLILVNEGFSVFCWCDQPGTVYGMHMHDEDQSHWVISGQMEITIERVGTFLLEAGDRDFMPAGTYHSARVIGEEPVNYLIGAKSKPAKSKNKKAKRKSKKAEDASAENDIRRLLDVLK